MALSFGKRAAQLPIELHFNLKMRKITTYQYQPRLVMHFIITIIVSMWCGVNCHKLPDRDRHDLRWEEKPLFVPDLNELAKALSVGLTKRYADVSIEVVDSPDLTEAPFYLASIGLSGSPTLIDVGSDSYFIPVPNFRKTYDFIDIARRALPKAKSILLTGAGAGPYEMKNSCCEGIYSVKIDENGFLESKSYVAFIKPSDNSFNLERIPSSETRFSFRNSLFASEGKKGKVIRIKVKRRIGTEGSFANNCRNAIIEAFRGRSIGIGGTFFMKNGKALHHVQPNCTEPIESEENIRKWLKYEEMPAPLVSVGIFVTDKMDLDLPLQHFHSFSENNWGGHYYYDTTPDTVEYEAYFNVAERVIRVDRHIVNSYT